MCRVLAGTVLSRIITDWWFRCASEQFAVYNTKAGTPAYVYVPTVLASSSAILLSSHLTTAPLVPPGTCSTTS